MRPILTLVLLMFVFCTVKAKVIYVRSDAQGDGSSWFNAFFDLQDALDEAIIGDEIWVASGTYYPTLCATCGLIDRNTSFVLKSGVHLYGGFGGWEGAPSERNLDIHTTILSGDIDQDGGKTLNSFNVLYASQLDMHTILDGFIIQDGNANLMNNPGNKENCGGGIYLDAQLSAGIIDIEIINCVFQNNSAIYYGGATYIDASFSGEANVLIENCKWLNNSNAGNGGAVYFNAGFEGIVNVQMNHSAFSYNISDSGQGGAVFNDGTENGHLTIVMEDLLFQNNLAGLDGGAIHNHGKRGNCFSILINCEFLNNSAGAIGGGAMYNDGSFSGNCQTFISKCHFSDNFSEGDGGAIYNLGSEGNLFVAEISTSQFVNNSCMNSGAAIFNNGYHGQCSPEIAHCVFEKNHTINYGGAIYNLGNEGICSPSILNCAFLKNRAYSAGAIYNLGSNGGQSSPIIINSTFYANRAEVGGAIYCNAKDSLGNSSAEIANCIFYKNFAPTGQVFRNIYGTPKISYSLVDLPDCNAFNSGDGANMQCTGPMLFNENPLFNDTLAGDFHLSEHSPGIDFGNTQLTNNFGLVHDLDNLNRVAGLAVDIGVFEYGNSISFNIINQPLSQSSCEGSSVSFQVEITPDLAVVYQWEKDGIPIPNADKATLELTNLKLTNSGAYTCILAFNGHIVESDTAFLAVKENLNVRANWLNKDTTICEGSLLTLETRVENGGLIPEYSWFLNDSLLAQETNESWQTGQLPSGVHKLVFSVKSSEQCLTNGMDYSEPLFVTVEKLEMPGIEIFGPDSVICHGDTVVITSDIHFGGNLPEYKWYLNDDKVDISDSYLVIDSLNNGDYLHCELFSSEKCVLNNPAKSNKIKAWVETCTSSTRKKEYSAEFLGYPNPVDDLYYVTIPENIEEFDVKIVDIFGNTVYSSQFVGLGRSLVTINCSHLSTGFYSVFLMGKFSGGVLSFVKGN